MEKSKTYVSPQIEILEIEIEKGFAATTLTEDEEGAWDHGF